MFFFSHLKKHVSKKHSVKLKVRIQTTEFYLCFSHIGQSGDSYFAKGLVLEKTDAV